jgi:hypothetical protein
LGANRRYLGSVKAYHTRWWTCCADKFSRAGVFSEVGGGGDLVNICVICGCPITGTMRGMGDGNGNKFAHDACYWRKRAEEAEKKIKYPENIVFKYINGGFVPYELKDGELTPVILLSRVHDPNKWIDDEPCRA